MKRICNFSILSTYGDHWSNTELGEPCLTQSANTATKYLSVSIFDLHKDSSEHFQIRSTLSEEQVCSQAIHKQTKSNVWGVHLLDNLFTMNYSANSTEGPAFFPLVMQRFFLWQLWTHIIFDWCFLYCNLFCLACKVSLGSTLFSTDLLIRRWMTTLTVWLEQMPQDGMSRRKIIFFN